MPTFKTNRDLLVIHQNVSLQVCYIDAISHKIEFGSHHTRSGSLQTGSVTYKNQPANFINYCVNFQTQKWTAAHAHKWFLSSMLQSSVIISKSLWDPHWMWNFNISRWINVLDLEVSRLVWESERNRSLDSKIKMLISQSNMPTSKTNSELTLFCTEVSFQTWSNDQQ